MPYRVPAAPLGLALLVAAVGCGPNTPSGTGATASGTVTLDGAPLPACMVIFAGGAGEGASSVTAYTDSEGKYAATNVPLGEVAVMVRHNPGADMARAMAKSKTQGMKGAPAAPDVPTTAVPERYADPGKSGLKLTVAAGGNPFDIALTAK